MAALGQSEQTSTLATTTSVFAALMCTCTQTNQTADINSYNFPLPENGVIFLGAFFSRALVMVGITATGKRGMAHYIICKGV